MSNMSHCMFSNTASDLADCYDWLSMHEPSELSEEEQRAFRRLVRTCKRIAEDYAEGVEP